MKQIRIISCYLQLGIMLFFLAACNDEYMPGENIPGENPDGVAQVALFTNADDFERPVTRAAAADENSIQGSMPWVLVFRGDNNNAVFFELSRAIGSGDKLTVPLTKTTNKSRLLIIANPPDKFFDGTADNLSMDETVLMSKLSGKTYAQALAILNTQKLSSPQRSVPYAGGYIPMSASVNLNSINGQTTIGTPASKVQLIRIVAKVSIENTAPGFVLDGFTVTGAKQYGTFLQATSSVSPGNKVHYLAASPADPVSGISSGKDPVYIYESASGETSVIVKGKYNGVIGYYRLAFKDGNNTELSIARNKWYQFKIKDVKIPGYKTLQEAVTASPSNMMVELLVTDQSSMEITDNGKYYIGLTNSEFVVFSNGEQKNLTAVTVTNNAPSGTFTKVEVLSANPANSMAISSGNIVPNGTVRSTDVQVHLNKPFTSGFLRITVGNLIRTVRVARQATMPWQGTRAIFNSEYVAGKIESQGNGGLTWISLSTDGVKYSSTEVTRDNPGTIYLKVDPNRSINARDGGVVYLARKNERGHHKIYISQLPNIER